jgi:hypothetical protein
MHKSTRLEDFPHNEVRKLELVAERLAKTGEDMASQVNEWMYWKGGGKPTEFEDFRHGFAMILSGWLGIVDHIDWMIDL